MKKALLVTCLLICAGFITRAQDKLNVKFGKIAPENFQISSPVVDSSSNAVVLFDIGNSEFEGNNKGGFSVLFKRHIRAKIINDKGMDVATFGIRLFKSHMGNESSIQDMRGATYNLENGTVVTTKLENKNIFSEETNKNFVTKKFTLPAVKAGSIIEYTYTVKSDAFVYLPSWEFQGEYPRLWSEYEVDIPEYFNYVFLAQGYQPFAVNSKDRTQKSFYISTSFGSQAAQNFNVNGDVNINRWVIKDAQAINAEPFTTTIRTHISKIEFQFAELRLLNQPT